MAEVGWDEVTYITKRNPKAAEMRSQQAVQAARRDGKTIDTSKKYSAGQNKQHSSAKDTAKLDRETEELHHEKVSLDVGKLIQKGRVEKKLSQKELATKINEKPSVINDYEAGRAIPNNQIIGKIERAIGIRLRGKEKGLPLAAGKPKKYTNISVYCTSAIDWFSKSKKEMEEIVYVEEQLFCYDNGQFNDAAMACNKQPVM